MKKIPVISLILISSFIAISVNAFWLTDFFKEKFLKEKEPIFGATILREYQGGTATSTYVTGDILYSDAANSLSSLPIGTAGQVLEVTAGIPAWGTDDTGAGGGAAWEAVATNVIAPTTTNAAILVNAASSTITNLWSDTINATTTNIGTLTIITGSTFPADDIVDAEVSDTLTASDLVAGSAVVADSEVVDALTIDTTNSIYTSGAFMIGNTSSTIPVLWNDNLYASSTFFTNASTTATSTSRGLKVENLISCNTIDTTAEGHFICGSDETGAGGGEPGSWATIWANVLAPTSTIAGTATGIFVDSASSTILTLWSDNLYATTTIFTNITVPTGGSFTAPNDTISEAIIDFNTACATGSHYYLNGNDLACEPDLNYPGQPGMWTTLATNVIQPTSTAAGLLINSASSTITNLWLDNLWATTTIFTDLEAMDDATITDHLAVDSTLYVRDSKVSVGQTTPTNTFTVIGNAYVQGNATTTGKMVIGGAQPGWNFAAGDLLVTGNSSTTATTTTKLLRFNNSYCIFQSDATTTPNLTIGTCPNP